MEYDKTRQIELGEEMGKWIADALYREPLTQEAALVQLKIFSGLLQELFIESYKNGLAAGEEVGYCKGRLSGLEDAKEVLDNWKKSIDKIFAPKEKN